MVAPFGLRRNQFQAAPLPVALAPFGRNGHTLLESP